jgi:hypothetical protein
LGIAAAFTRVSQQIPNLHAAIEQPQYQHLPSSNEVVLERESTPSPGHRLTLVTTEQTRHESAAMNALSRGVTRATPS